jgi:hypothetical protein
MVEARATGAIGSRAGRRRSSGRRAADELVVAARQYSALGWPVCPGAQPRERGPRGRQTRERHLQLREVRQGGSGRACSCDRVGCPAPGAHPLSPVWKLQATVDPAVIGHWWSEQPGASILLVTGRTFDVLDVPLPAGRLALAGLEGAGIACGPVAASAQDRALFFVASRAAVVDDDEFWSCHLDCVPEVLPEVTGLRWHCRDSYVVAPPSRLGDGSAASWLTEPGTNPLPDALRLLEVLADACEEIVR